LLKVCIDIYGQSEVVSEREREDIMVGEENVLGDRTAEQGVLVEEKAQCL